MKIASIENLELLLSTVKNKYLCFLREESALSDFFKANLKSSQIKFLEKNKSVEKLLTNSEKDSIKTSNLSIILTQEKAHTFLPALHSSKWLEDWAKKHQQQLLVTSYKLQKKLENKIFFHNLLLKNNLPLPKGQIIESLKELKTLKKLPLVIQIPLSEGSQGTFIIQNKNDLLALCNKQKLKFPLLAREYIKNALPLGVSLLVGKNKSIFSALRLQAYLESEENRHEFYGIQWIKTSFFPKEIISKLNKQLRKLSEVLQKQHFRGVANIDFLVKGKEIYFIECNPRLAGSSPQMTYKKELFHGYDFIQEFNKAVIGKKLSVDRQEIPSSNFGGCTIDLDYAKKQILNKKPIENLPCGVFKLNKKKLKFISNKLQNYSSKNDILIAHNLVKTRKITATAYLGFCLYQKPFIEIKKSNYKFSKKGMELLEIINLELKKITC